MCRCNRRPRGGGERLCGHRARRRRGCPAGMMSRSFFGWRRVCIGRRGGKQAGYERRRRPVHPLDCSLSRGSCHRILDPESKYPGVAPVKITFCTLMVAALHGYFSPLTRYAPGLPGVVRAITAWIYVNMHRSCCPKKYRGNVWICHTRKYYTNVCRYSCIGRYMRNAQCFVVGLRGSGRNDEGSVVEPGHVDRRRDDAG